ncbi:hypothetical protein [Dankookia sp. P2]|uniref:hypothetical protein n=1 Tax=Dankookia sp. P2 TaxID=3423955 RepID=UPI003D671758
MPRHILRHGALPRLAAAQQAEPRFEPAAHVLKEGVAAAEILLEQPGGDLDLEARPPGQGEALQRPAVLRQREVQPVQIRQMPRDLQPGLTGLLGQGIGVRHPPCAFSGPSRMRRRH